MSTKFHSQLFSVGHWFINKEDTLKEKPAYCWQVSKLDQGMVRLDLYRDGVFSKRVSSPLTGLESSIRGGSVIVMDHAPWIQPNATKVGPVIVGSPESMDDALYCTCGGPTRGSMTFNGTPFKVCTVCNQEAR